MWAGRGTGTAIPGARCDTESLDYSYSFDPQLKQDWVWSERYATQGEILRYLEYVADRYDLRSLVRFGSRVVRANWSNETGRWTIELADGQISEARFLFWRRGAFLRPRHRTFRGLNTLPGQFIRPSPRCRRAAVSARGPG